MAYDVGRFGPFRPDFAIGDTPVMRTRSEKNPSVHLYVSGAGAYMVPNGKTGKPLRPLAVHLEEKSGVVRLTLQELCICCRAVIDVAHRASEGSTSAQWIGGGGESGDRTIVFSRSEDGVDVRRFIELPAFVDLPAQRDKTGKRIDTPVVSALEVAAEAAASLPPEGDAGATD